MVPATDQVYTKLREQNGKVLILACSEEAAIELTK